jgi:hypothetical protein
MSDVKEPNFFAFEKCTQLMDPHGSRNLPRYSMEYEKYLSLFDGIQGQDVIAEASPTYLSSPTAPGRIESKLGNVNIIVMIRNPVDRAFSAYLFNKNSGKEVASSFESALEMEEKRVEKSCYDPGYFYKRLGNYSHGIARYKSKFDNVKIIQFEDFVCNTKSEVKKVFSFLGINDDKSVNTNMIKASSGKLRSKTLKNLILHDSAFKRFIKRVLPGQLRHWLRKSLLKQVNISNEKPEMNLHTRKYLRKYYAVEFERLIDLLSIDLRK